MLKNTGAFSILVVVSFYAIVATEKSVEQIRRERILQLLQADTTENEAELAELANKFRADYQQALAEYQRIKGAGPEQRGLEARKTQQRAELKAHQAEYGKQGPKLTAEGAAELMRRLPEEIGSYTATMAESRAYEFWKNLRLARYTGYMRSVVFSPVADNIVLSVFDNPSRIGLWTITPDGTTTTLRFLAGYNEPVASVAFSPDGTTLATGSADGRIRLHNAQTGALLREFAHMPTTPWINSLAFSSDGLTIAAAMDTAGVGLWNVATGTFRVGAGVAQGEFVNAVAFNPVNRNMLVVGSIGGGAQLWDVATGEVRDIDGPRGTVTAVAFSPDGTLLAVGTRDALELYNVATGERTNIMQPNAPNSTSVAFSRDSKIIAAGSVDGSIKLWRMRLQTDVRKSLRRALLNERQEHILKLLQGEQSPEVTQELRKFKSNYPADYKRAVERYQRELKEQERRSTKKEKPCVIC